MKAVLPVRSIDAAMRGAAAAVWSRGGVRILGFCQTGVPTQQACGSALSGKTSRSSSPRGAPRRWRERPAPRAWQAERFRLTRAAVVGRRVAGALVVRRARGEAPSPSPSPAAAACQVRTRGAARMPALNGLVTKAEAEPRARARMTAARMMIKSVGLRIICAFDVRVGWRRSEVESSV